MSLSTSYNSVYEHEVVRLFDFPLRYPRNRMEALVRFSPKAKRVLEVGFGNGNVLFNLRDQAEELYGIEISKVRCALANKNLKEAGLRANCSVGNVEKKLSFPDGYFDLIIWADVIEHVIDVWAAMFEINRIMKGGGTLVTVTPNIAYLKRRIRLLGGAFPSTSGADEGVKVRDGELFDGGHVHYFTFSSLEKIYSRFGFNPQKRYGFGPLGRIHNIVPSLLSNCVCVKGVKEYDV